MTYAIYSVLFSYGRLFRTLKTQFLLFPTMVVAFGSLFVLRRPALVLSKEVDRIPDDNSFYSGIASSRPYL